MQHAMKVQQQYAGLVARGDELFTGIRGDAEPGLATFDDDGDAAPAQGFRGSAFDRADVVPDEVPDRVGAQTTIEESVAEAPATEEILEELAIDEAIEAAPTLEETAPAVAAGDAGRGAHRARGHRGRAARRRRGRHRRHPDLRGRAERRRQRHHHRRRRRHRRGHRHPGGRRLHRHHRRRHRHRPRRRPDRRRGMGVDDDGRRRRRSHRGGRRRGRRRCRLGGRRPTPAATERAAGGSAPAEAPIDGYDSFSIAQLRGRLRGYALSHGVRARRLRGVRRGPARTTSGCCATAWRSSRSRRSSPARWPRAAPEPRRRGAGTEPERPRTTPVLGLSGQRSCTARSGPG